MKGKVAITGSTGMLGSHLVAELLRRGYGDIVLPVRNLVRLDALAVTLRREGFPDEADRLTGDRKGALHPVEVQMNDPIGLREALQGVEILFHCAAVVSLTNESPEELIETNVEITSHVARAALECRVKRMVHTSSIAALGEKPGGSLIDETTNLENLAGTSPYGISKFYSENKVWRAAAEGLEVVVVNPAVILGEGDWSSGGSTLIIPFAASGIPFYTAGEVGYVDVKDVARAEADLAVCEAAAGERFVLCAENLSYKEFISTVAKLAGKRPPFIRAGKLLLGVVWRSQALWYKLTGRKPSLSRAAAVSAAKVSRYDGGKVKRYIPGFEYTPVDETIERVVKAYKHGK